MLRTTPASGEESTALIDVPVTETDEDDEPEGPAGEALPQADAALRTTASTGRAHRDCIAAVSGKQLSAIS
jgi:hypothetical protein